jgi:hypothetical protein
MFLKLFAVLAFLSCLFCADAHAEAENKLLALKRVNAITEKLLVIANERQILSRKGIESFEDSQIINLVHAQRDIDVLYRLAAVSKSYATPGHAEDHVVDDVFYTTWSACVGRIEKIGGKAAIQALEDIQKDYFLDGDPALEISEALDRLKGRKQH